MAIVGEIANRLAVMSEGRISKPVTRKGFLLLRSFP
jgi:hypothetical protein